MSAVSDAEILSAYDELGSVWKVGERVGLCGQSVHERLQRLGAARPVRVFTDAERDRLIRDYQAYRAAGKVSDLAAELGRTVPYLSRQARALGLTTHRYPKEYAPKHQVSDADVRAMFEEFKASNLSPEAFSISKGHGKDWVRARVAERWPAEWDIAIADRRVLDPKTYTGAHANVASRRGKASEHDCVDCGQPAAHWSYDHTDPAERSEDRGTYALRFSADISRYHPRCLPCHSALDAAWRNR